MKNTMFLLALVLSFTACQNSTQTSGNGVNPDQIKNPNSLSGQDTTGFPVMTFETTTHDFGTIDEGAKVEYAFKFTNTGNADLIITDAQSTCGCTIPSYPREPIPPGGHGVIPVVFNSRGKRNNVSKEIKIIANTNPSTNYLNITAFVVPAQ